MAIAATPAGRRDPAIWMLVLVLGGMAVAFQAELQAAITTWTHSTAYSHCWLVLPIAGWLASTRRHRLAGLRPEPSALLALPALGAAFAWLVAERLGIMEGRQLAALGLAEVAVVALLGWRIARAMAAPLAYLVFLVPFGGFLVPPLQDATAAIILLGLRIAGIPHFADGLIIEIPAGTFLVAEACAGLRFVIASLAFGTLYAFVMFRSAGRRMAVMALALIMPVLANGLRALGIVLLGHHLGNAEAAAVDHLVYGWGFFSVVMGMLILAGLPFRQDGGSAGPVPSPRLTPRIGTAALFGAAALVLAPLAAVRAGTAWLDMAGAGAPIAVAARLTIPPGCVAAPQTEALSETLLCGDARIAARLLVFSPRVNWAAVVAARGQAAGQNDEDTIFAVATADTAWRVRQGTAGAETIAVAVWLGGRPSGDGLRGRATQAWNALGAGLGRPVLAVVTLRAAEPARRDAAAGQRERALMRRILEAQAASLAQQAAALSRTP